MSRLTASAPGSVGVPAGDPAITTRARGGRISPSSPLGRRGSPAPRRLSADERERIEIEFWTTSPEESPGSETIWNMFSKMVEAGVLVEKLDAFTDVFASASAILELGGGQSWASCIVKKRWPDASVVASDIAPAALASTAQWERTFDVRLDGVAACPSSATPFPDGAFDLAFAFATAHHFARHLDTLKELKRVLRPGGHALYLHEPSCRPFLYGIAVRRVNRNRPSVPEDVLVPQRLVEVAAKAGLEVEYHYAPTTTARGPKQTVYYELLGRVPRLCQWLPCSIDVVFRKPAR